MVSDSPPDPELAALRAALAEAHGEGRWHVWRGENGSGGIFHAWLQPSTSPPVVLYDAMTAGLRARVDEFERVFAETHGLGKALAAAERLRT